MRVYREVIWNNMFALNNLLFIIYVRKSEQTKVFLLGALNDYEDE